MLSMPSTLAQYKVLLLLFVLASELLCGWVAEASDRLLDVGCTTDSTKQGCRLAICSIAGQSSMLLTAEAVLLEAPRPV
jgi:hypothetical protein